MTLFLAVALLAGSASARTIDFLEALQLAAGGPSVVLSQSALLVAEQSLTAAAGVVSASVGLGATASVARAGDGADTTTGLDLDPITLSATFNVVPFGSTYDSLQQARRQVTEAELALRDARAGALVSATQRYLEALRGQQELDLRTAELALAEARLEATSVRLEAGAATDQDRFDAELAVTEASSALASATRSLAQTLAVLSSLLGVDVEAVAGEAPPASLPEDVSVAERLAERTDVVRAGHTLEQAEASLASAQRNALPSASLSLRYSASNGEQGVGASTSIDTRSFQPAVTLSFDPSSSTPAGSQNLNLALGVTVPLDSSGQAQRQSAALNLQQSEIRAEQAYAQAELEVRNAERQLEAATTGEELSRLSLESRQRSLDIARQRFDLGIITELDLRQAELNLLSATLAHDKSADSLLLAQLTYLQALALDPSEAFK